MIGHTADIRPARSPTASDRLSPAVRALFRQLPGAGPPAADSAGDAAAGSWHTGRAGGRELGTDVAVHIRCTSPNGPVTDARFQALGCPHTLATAAWVTQRLVGRSVADLLPDGPRDWAKALQVPVTRLGRLLLIEDAILAAKRSARGLQPA